MTTVDRKAELYDLSQQHSANVAGGLAVTTIYKTSTGELRIVF